MLTLDLLTRATQELNLVVTTVNRGIQTDMIPGLDPTETVDVYFVSDYRENLMQQPKVDMMVAETASGEVYLIYILATTRFADTNYFLNRDQYKFYLKSALPILSVEHAPNWVEAPVQFTTHAGDVEYYYVRPVHTLNVLDGQEIVENILRNSLSNLLYWGAMYDSVTHALFDIGTNTWVNNVADMAAMNTINTSIACVRNGVAWFTNRNYSSGLVYFAGRFYYGISSLYSPETGVRSYLGVQEEMHNDVVLAPYMEFWDRAGLEVSLGILKETDKGPLRGIAKMMMEMSSLSYNSNLYDILYMEITPRNQLSAVRDIENIQAVLSTDRWARTNLTVSRSNPLPYTVNDGVVEIPSDSNARDFLRTIGAAISEATGLQVDVDGFFKPPTPDELNESMKKRTPPASTLNETFDESDYFLPSGKSS